jgi:hypothetical protein
MDFIPQRPNIKNNRSFLYGMAEAIEQLHDEGLALGGFSDVEFVDWLNVAQDAFDAERFKAGARPVADSGGDAIYADVRAFASCSVRLISDGIAQAGAPFLAALYSGGEWSRSFLTLLETMEGSPSDRNVSISQLKAALKPEASPIALASAPVASAPVASAPVASAPVASAPAAAVPAGVFAQSRTAPPPPTIRVALRNATVGKPYQVEPGSIVAAIARQRGDNPEHARISHLQLPDGCGLVFDKATGAVTGTPTSAFDGSLNLDYVPFRSERSISFNISFLINPDPSSLWKDLPPPADAPYQKPLTDQFEKQYGSFRVVAASCRGRSHANKGEFRDDDFGVGYAPDSGWLVVVVADGAGSATYSRRGSQIACAVAKERLTRALNNPQHNRAEALYAEDRDWQHPEVSDALRQLLYESALDAHHKLLAEVSQPSETLPTPPVIRNFDTTLILLVMKRVGAGCVAATFAIGDGGAGLFTRPGTGFPITKPEGGDYAGQTWFMTMRETLKNDEASLAHRFQFFWQREFCAAFSMTDGITDPKFPSDAAFADPTQWAAFYSELQPALASSQALLNWMNFFSPGNHDDRTLVAVLPAQTATPATP